MMWPVASAQPITIGERFCSLANAGDLTAEQALERRDTFICGAQTLSGDANHIWLLGEIGDVAAQFPDPAVSLDMSYHGAITFAQIGDGRVLASQWFSPQDLANRALVPGKMVFPLNADETARTTGVLIGIDQTWDLYNWTAIAVTSWAEAMDRHVSNAVFFGLLTGLLITPLMLISLVYPVLRHSFLPFHFGMLASALIYGLSWSGLLNVLPFTILPITRSVINHVAIPFAFMFACFLTRELCEARTLGRFWSGSLPIAGIIPVLSSLTFMALAPDFSSFAPTVYHAMFVLPLVAIVGALVHGALNGKLICQLQLLAWTPMILYVIGRIGRGVGLVDEFTPLDFGLYPSLIAEALLTTSIVTFQMFRLRKERDTALITQNVLHDLASSDELTGMMNRRAFIERFNQVTRAGLASARVVSLLVIDIDNFKRVNDAYGHSIGDGVLVKLAHILRSHCRAEDACARFGGEEFCMLLSTPTGAAADACAERLLASVAQQDFAVAGPITISIGVVQVNGDHHAPFESWFSAADMALYSAKNSGRNCVRRSSWLPTPLPDTNAAYAEGWQPRKA